jgi:hypothetical protein
MRGSIRRRDSRRNAANGPQRWELRVYLGRDKNGQAKQATRAFAGPKREAESALAGFVSEVERGRRARTSRALLLPTRANGLRAVREPRTWLLSHWSATKASSVTIWCHISATSGCPRLALTRFVRLLRNGVPAGGRMGSRVF